MDTNKNSYTLIYSIVMVVIIAFLLSFVSSALKDRQIANVELDKKRQILSALNSSANPLNMTGGREAIEKLYSTLIVNGLVVNSNGDVLHESNDDAFAIDIAREMGRPLAERELPVFVANINGQTKYILALRGAGLWGPIWGYVALNDDFNTIFGVFFSHTSETPGLGSQIAENEFQNQFVQKVIMNNRNELVSVAVMKEGARDNNREQVDAITGGTITSKAVETMLFDGLQQYNNFLQQRRNLTEGGTE